MGAIKKHKSIDAGWPILRNYLKARYLSRVSKNLEHSLVRVLERRVGLVSCEQLYGALEHSISLIDDD